MKPVLGSDGPIGDCRRVERWLNGTLRTGACSSKTAYKWFVATRTTPMASSLPLLRRHAIDALAKSLHTSKRRAKSMEAQCWQTGPQSYPLFVRRMCVGMTFEEASASLEPYEVEEGTVDVAQGDLQCGKCRSRRVHRVEMQTRSADESATVFCQCADCGNRWKF